MGLDPAGVEVLATFPDLFLTPSQNAVTPVLAWWPVPVPVGVVDRGEVEQVLRVRVADLLDPANRFTTVLGPYRGPGFEVDGLFVWGFTAMLLSSLFDLRDGRALGRRPSSAACPTGCARRGCVGSRSERVGPARPRARRPAGALCVERVAPGVRVGASSVSSASWGAPSSRCASCPRMARGPSGDLPVETPVGVLALVVVVLAAAALGQELMLLLARRVRESVRGAQCARRRCRVRPRRGALGIRARPVGWSAGRGPAAARRRRGLARSAVVSASTSVAAVGGPASSTR